MLYICLIIESKLNIISKKYTKIAIVSYNTIRIYDIVEYAKTEA